MSRIVFETGRPLAQTHPGRADVACFVGLARRVPNATLSPAALAWLTQQGWADGPFARPIASLTDIPIPVESWPAFTALFGAGGGAASFGTDYVAAAVRSFFAQGGKLCYVVRMDDPVAPGDSSSTRAAKLQGLLPGNTYAGDDPRGWHGAGHLSGLPDVSFLCLPDLPALTASQPLGAVGQSPVAPSGPEMFVECSAPQPLVETPLTYAAAAPRHSPDDYAAWAAAVRTVLLYLSIGQRREMQLIAALPMPQEIAVAASVENPGATALQDIHEAIDALLPEPQPGGGDGSQTGLDIGISSAFLQLAYPWLRTSGSGVLLESYEPPDGVLAGMLARNALTRGTFSSAVKVAPAEVFDVSTILPAQETRVSATPLTWGDNSFKPLVERVSLFGFTPAGLRLLSDVTAYAGESYRPGRIHRLVAVILRESRRLGEQVAFMNNGPQLWSRVRTSLRQLMTALWQRGALDGGSAADAFSIACDRGTMTQNDLDNGRLVAVVSFNSASTIELIRVTLALGTSGAAAQTITDAQTTTALAEVA